MATGRRSFTDDCKTLYGALNAALPERIFARLARRLSEVLADRMDPSTPLGREAPLAVKTNYAPFTIDEVKRCYGLLLRASAIRARSIDHLYELFAASAYVPKYRLETFHSNLRFIDLELLSKDLAEATKSAINPGSMVVHDESFNTFTGCPKYKPIWFMPRKPSGPWGTLLYVTCMKLGLSGLPIYYELCPIVVKGALTPADTVIRMLNGWFEDERTRHLPIQVTTDAAFATRAVLNYKPPNGKPNRVFFIMSANEQYLPEVFRPLLHDIQPHESRCILQTETNLFAMAVQFEQKESRRFTLLSNAYVVKADDTPLAVPNEPDFTTPSTSSPSSEPPEDPFLHNSSSPSEYRLRATTPWDLVSAGHLLKIRREALNEVAKQFGVLEGMLNLW